MPSQTIAPRQAAHIANCGLVSGVLLGLSFPPTDWSFLAWVALVPLGVVFCSPTMSLQSWAGVYLGGLLYHLWVLDWMRTLYGGVGLTGDYVSCWLISAQMGALLYCMMITIGRRGVRAAKLPVTMMLPLAWMSYEIVQHWVTARLSPTGTSFLSLSQTQADQAVVAQIADLGGAGLISLVVATVNGFCYDTIVVVRSSLQGKGVSHRGTKLATVPLAVVTVLYYGNARLAQVDTKSGPTVCLMGQDDLPPLLVKNRVLLSRTGPTPSRDAEVADLLVWPELAYHHDLLVPPADRNAQRALSDACPLANGNLLDYSHTVKQYLEQAAAKLQTSLLIGCQRLEFSATEVRRYNGLSYVDPVFGLRDRYDKRHLAPFVEFTPASARWLQIANRTNYTPGNEATPITLYTDLGASAYQIGCAVCFDIAFSQHFLQLLKSDVSFFVVSGSEAADATGTLSTMLLRMAQLRAIETRRAIVRNTYLGFSSLISANGRIVQARDRQPLRAPWQLGSVPLDDRTSLYSRWGNWVFPTCWTALSVVLIGPLVNRLWSRLPAASRVAPRWRSPEQRHLSKVRRNAFSLLELLAVIAIIGTITALLIPKVSTSAAAAKTASDKINRAKINAAVERWYLEKDVWPALDLSDIGADPDYFPDGIPNNPINNLSYSLNATTHRVIVSGGGGGGGK